MNSALRLNRISTNILQALRAGGMNEVAMGERFGTSYQKDFYALIKVGYVIKHADDVYRITLLGREHCPNRNKLLNKKPVAKAMHDQPITLLILNYIEANPACKSGEIKHALGIDEMQGHIRKQLTYGLVEVTRTNFRQSGFSLKAGVSAAQAYAFESPRKGRYANKQKNNINANQHLQAA